MYSDSNVINSIETCTKVYIIIPERMIFLTGDNFDGANGFKMRFTITPIYDNKILNVF